MLPVLLPKMSQMHPHLWDTLYQRRFGREVDASARRSNEVPHTSSGSSSSVSSNEGIPDITTQQQRSRQDFVFQVYSATPMTPFLPREGVMDAAARQDTNMRSPVTPTMQTPTNVAIPRVFVNGTINQAPASSIWSRNRPYQAADHLIPQWEQDSFFYRTLLMTILVLPTDFIEALRLRTGISTPKNFCLFFYKPPEDELRRDYFDEELNQEFLRHSTLQPS